MSDADPIGPVQRDAPLRPLDAGRDRPPRPRTPPPHPEREPHHEPPPDSDGGTGDDEPPPDSDGGTGDDEPRRRGGQIDEMA